MYPGFVWVVDKADVAAKAIQPPFYPQLKAFVLILKTLHPAPLAILRGEGQHSILLFLCVFGGGGIHERQGWDCKLIEIEDGMMNVPDFP